MNSNGIDELLKELGVWGAGPCSVENQNAATVVEYFLSERALSLPVKEVRDAMWTHALLAVRCPMCLATRVLKVTDFTTTMNDEGLRITGVQVTEARLWCTACGARYDLYTEDETLEETNRSRERRPIRFGGY